MMLQYPESERRSDVASEPTVNESVNDSGEHASAGSAEPVRPVRGAVKNKPARAPRRMAGGRFRAVRVRARRRKPAAEKGRAAPATRGARLTTRRQARQPEAGRDGKSERETLVIRDVDIPAFRMIGLQFEVILTSAIAVMLMAIIFLAGMAFFWGAWYLLVDKLGLIDIDNILDMFIL